ncbi:MAG: PBP1A family penicillin-binding protein [Alphaproteobacteria bacterium]|nr:PBP1A family penicillin-binding protein [Alphaproteobacteria bacterium]
MGKGNGKRRSPRRSSARKARPEAYDDEDEGAGKRWSLLHGIAVAAVWVGVLVAGTLAYFAADLPSTEGLWRQEKTQAVTLLDAGGRAISRRGIDSGLPVTLKDLPPHVAQAVLASEDRRFYSHFGLDFWGLGRAAWVNMQAGRVVQGGSTITQQLAKNLFLKPERTYGRKIQEALLAVYLEMSFSKDEILALYLNRVYFGAGAYGIDAASRRYFNKPASRLTLVEAAILAGLLKAPTRYSPVNGIELAQSRANVVLQSMVEVGYIDKAARDEALHTRPKLATGQSVQGNQYFADWVMEQLPGLVGRPGTDIVVETTLDLQLQRAAEDAVVKTLREKASPNAQGALVAMTTDGAVKAMVGGRAYMMSEFNRATQAKRQPGSAFKPFVYLAAMEAGRSPASHMVDAQVTYRGWTPANYSGTYEGDMTLTDALSRSVNTVAVKLCLELGPETVAQTARRLGIVSDLAAVPSLALGTSEVSLIELVNGYVPFATGGRGAIPHGITRVTSIAGEVLYERVGSGLGNVTTAEAAGAVNRMLMQAVRTGTGKAAALDGRPTAGKTGTSQDFKDAWFVGYTRQMVAGVWVGNDANLPMGKEIRGGTLPATMWKSFMVQAMAGQPIMPLPGSDVVDQPEEGDDASAFDELLAGLFSDSKPEAATTN